MIVSFQLPGVVVTSAPRCVDDVTGRLAQHRRSPASSGPTLGGMRTHGTVRTGDGTRLAYQIEGSGPPLLLLAGQANHHGWWDPVRPDFAAFRTVTVDWRGTGGSEEGAVDFTTRTLADDLVEILDAAGVATVDVYGTSMGGRVAQWLAVDHPERVASFSAARRRVAGTPSSAARKYAAGWRSPTATRRAKPWPT